MTAQILEFGRPCNICLRKLADPHDLTTIDCGGTCLRCMAEAGDPDCMNTMRQIEPGWAPKGDGELLPMDNLEVTEDQAMEALRNLKAADAWAFSAGAPEFIMDSILDAEAVIALLVHKLWPTAPWPPKAGPDEDGEVPF